MNGKINYDITTVKFLYDKYKDYLLPLAIVFVCFILFAKIIIPQINNLSQARVQAKMEKEKLLVLRNNLRLISDLNEGNLDSQLSITSDALPNGKDFAGVLNAVSFAASKTGVFLGDYEFQVGDLSKSVASSGGIFPSLQLVLTVQGGVNATVKFVEELYKSVPLSQITSVKISGGRSIITAVFYYKPFPPVALDSQPMREVSRDDLTTIKNISLWNNPKNLNQVISIPQSSTGSADLNTTSPF